MKLNSARHWAPPVAQAWLAAALASAVLGLLQYFGLSAGLEPWVNSTSAGEAFANLRQRNQFATLCSVGLLALLWQVGQWRTVHANSNTAQLAPDTAQWLQWLQWLQWGLWALLLACGNAASGSRTGLLQWWLVAGLALLWWRRGRTGVPTASVHGRVTIVAFAALAAYLVGLLVLPWALHEATGFVSDGLLGRFKEEAGCSSRRVLWANVLHLIAQKPWLGWGWGELDFAHFVTLYPGERFCDILDNAHNLPLHLVVELGVPFAVVACAVMGWLVVRAKPWCETDATRQMAWGTLAVIGLHSLLEYPLWYGPFQIAAGLCVWLLWATPKPAKNPAMELQRGRNYMTLWPAARVGIALFAMLLIAFVAFAGWDYWRVSQLYLTQSDRAAAYREDTMNKVRGSLLFQNQVQFADLTTTPVTQGNAEQIYTMAQQLLHFSPEPRVAEKLIESAVMLGHDDEAIYYLQRYAAAFPQAHALWASASGGNKAP